MKKTKQNKRVEAKSDEYYLSSDLGYPCKIKQRDPCRLRRTLLTKEALIDVIRITKKAILGHSDTKTS